MAEIAHFFDWTDTDYSETSASYATQRTIASSNFVAGGKYLCFWAASIGTSSTSYPQGAILSWSTGGDIAHTEGVREPYFANTSPLGQPWSGVSVLTVPSPSEDLLIKLKASSGTAYLYSWRFIAIRLDEDLTENTDWFSSAQDDSASPPEFSTSYGTFATKTATLAAGQWAFFNMMQSEVNSASYELYQGYSASGGGITSETDVNSWTAEGEDLDEILCTQGLWRVFDLDGTSFTYSARGREENTSANGKHLYSEVIGVNLDLFSEAHETYNAGQHTLGTGNSWTETMGLTPFTPNVADIDWILLGEAKANMGFSAAYEQTSRIQLGGVSKPSSQDDLTATTGNDNTDWYIFHRMSVENLANSSQDIDLDVWSESTSYDDWWRRGILAWSMELAFDGDSLFADDVESSSETSSPVITQEHVLTATSEESTSEVTAPVVGQEQALLSVSVESSSEVSNPILSESHAVLADDVESASELTVPALSQEHGLTSVGSESASELSVPVVGQAHSLAVVSSESASEVSSPALVEVGGTHALLAEDVESAGEVSGPSIGQEHSLNADDIESASELTAPVLAEASSEHTLLAEDAESASELSSPAVGQGHVLTVVSIDSASEISSPVINGIKEQPSTGGWALPYHEKEEKKQEYIQEQEQQEQKTEKPRKVIRLKQPVDLSVEKTQALKLEAGLLESKIADQQEQIIKEIAALESVVEADRLEALRIARIEAERIEAERIEEELRWQEEELMVTLLLMAS